MQGRPNYCPLYGAFLNYLIQIMIMKRLSSLMVFFIPLILFSQSDTSSKGIKFEEGLNWQQVKEKAEKDQKYIFVDCYATRCAPCKQMEKEVYPFRQSGCLF